MTRTQIYLQKKQIELLKRRAQARHVSMSEMIRSILDAELDDRGSLPVRHEGLLAAAKRINPHGARAPKDLARHLDRYLYGA